MEPEIAHRCAICGAAIRARATFCPQCGVPVPKDAALSAPVKAAPEATGTPTLPAAEAGADAPKLAPTLPLEMPADSSAPESASAPSSKDTATLSSPRESPPPASDARSPVPPPGDAAVTRQRVATAAHDVNHESLLPRTEKLRRASSGVLDEAATDPSLRFVLVAAVLLLLSLLLLLLGRIL